MPVAWAEGGYPGLQELTTLTGLAMYTAPPALQTADLERVGECCSNLRELHLSCSTQPPLNVSGSLVNLPALTCLMIAPFGKVCAEDFHMVEQMAAERNVCIRLNG